MVGREGISLQMKDKGRPKPPGKIVAPAKAGARLIF